MYFTDVTITGVSTKYTGKATAASAGGGYLTAYAVDPSIPASAKGESFKITGEEGVPSYTGDAEVIFPAMVVFSNVKNG